MISMRLSISLFLVTIICTESGKGNSNSSKTRQQYLLYSWEKMWNGECGQEELEEFVESGPCFTNTWDTPSKRRNLWCICNREGREIGSLFLYGIAQMTRDAMNLGYEGCQSEDIVNVRKTMAEGHANVPFLKIYALMSDGGADVPEHNLVTSIVWYNNNCAGTAKEKVDGVAVNNEDFPKYGSKQEKMNYLTNLAKISLKAGNDLLTHYSLGWHWFEAGNVTFSGVTKNVVKHMIDIFNSTDMQTAYVLGDVILDRLQKGFDGTAATPPHVGGDNYYSYSTSQGKDTYFTLYLSRIEDLSNCPTTFFPRPECDGVMGWDVVAYQTEARMWEQVDVVTNNLTSLPSLHFYRGVYTSGGHPDWPDFCSHVPIVKYC